MKKYFSRILIPFFIIAILFGSFGVGKVGAIADNPECSSLTGAAQSNCDYYYNNTTDANTSGYVEITNQDGSKNRYYPNGDQTVTTSSGVTTQVSGITTTETTGTDTQTTQTENDTINPQDAEVTITGGDGTSIKVNSDGSITDSSDRCGKVGKPGSAQQIQCYLDQNCAGMTSTEYDSCKANILRSQKKILGGNITGETDGWFVFSETLKNMPGVLADGVIKSAIAVVGGFIQLIIIPILGIILRIIAGCLDLSIQFALDSARITGVNAAITEIWVIVRNIFNISFIFILLWSAIQMIMGLAGAKTKEIIAHVVVAALLINFSLFVTRILIDAGNILAVNLYNSATATSTISDTMMQMFGISALYATTNANDIFSTSFFVISALQFITILTAIITMSYIMMMMIVRNVMLIFLMAISPIGFMGDVLPKLNEYSKMWWDNLYGQIFIAPIFLLFYYLITLISGKISAVALSGENKDYTQYFKYVMLIILLVAAVKITKKMSGVVGSVVEKFGTAAAGMAIGAAAGGLALAGRATIGRGAANLANSRAGEWLKDQKDKGSWGAKLALKGMDRTSKATFDARNTKTAGNVMGQIKEHTGLNVDIGKTSGKYGKSSGYAGWMDQQKKDAAEEAKERDKRAQKYMEDPGNKAYVEELRGQINERAKREAENNTNEAIREDRHRERTNFARRISEQEAVVNSNTASEQERREAARELAKATAEKNKYEEIILEAEKKKAETEITANDSEAKYALQRAEAKRKYAEQVRNKFATFRTSGENESVADSLGNVKYDASKEKADREQKNILDEIKKMIKESQDK